MRPGCRHVYYTWAAKLDEARLGVSRKDFSAALTAEGFPHFLGYVTPLYMLPVFQKKIAFGRDGWPFNLTNRQYNKGLCPVAERMHERELLGFETCAYRVDNQHIALLIEAVHKVYTHRHAIPVSEGVLHA